MVLGAGGVAGTAWMIGLAAGLRRSGVDLAEADLIVGTSAGAIVGALVATHQDLDRLAFPAREGSSGERLDEGERLVVPAPEGAPGAGRLDMEDRLVVPARGEPAGAGRLNEVFQVLSDPELEPAEARRRVGRIALASGGGTEHLARMESLIGAGGWPDRALLVTGVDVWTGEPLVWDRTSGVPLASAVAASSSMPGVYPPVVIGGRPYMDGGLRSGTNADLATGSRTLLVIEPLAHLFPRERLHRELAEAGPETTVTITPDDRSLNAFGTDLHDRAAWRPSYAAGAAQAAGAARLIGGRRTRSAPLRPRQPPV